MKERAEPAATRIYLSWRR